MSLLGRSRARVHSVHVVLGGLAGGRVAAGGPGSPRASVLRDLSIVTAIGIPVWLSAIVFAGVAMGGTLLVRPTLKRVSDRHLGPRLALPGSSDGLLGSRALTLDAVGDEHHPGHARLAGERWLAVTDEPGGVAPDTQVMVVEVRGTTLVVMPFSGG